ncbi:MAG: PAS domain-containing protein [Hyphomicrobium sp.]
MNTEGGHTINRATASHQQAAMVGTFAANYLSNIPRIAHGGLAGKSALKQADVDRLSQIFELSGMSFLLSDARQIDMPIVYANAAFYRLTGYDADSVIGRNCRFLQGPKTDPATIATIRSALDREQSVTVDILNYRKDASTFWNGLYISPVFGENGSVDYFLGAQFDASERRREVTDLEVRNSALEAEVASQTVDITHNITAMKQLVDEKALLLHELHHRVRNNIQMISSMITIQIKNASDIKERSSLFSLKKRVDALGAVNRRLNNPDRIGSFDVGQLVEDLAPDITAAYAGNAVTLRFDVATAMLPNRMASAAALILNEVITTLLRAANLSHDGAVLSFAVAPGERTANIFIDIASHADVATDVTTIGHVPSHPVAPALAGNHKLVEALLRQVRGTVAFHATATGRRAVLSFPLE